MSTAKGLLVRAAAESRTGFARGNNEDNVYFNGDFITPRTIRDDFAIKTGEYSDINVFAVLDGMGRNNTGSYASLLAATRLDDVADRITFDTQRTPDEIVLDYIQNTNVAIREQVHDTGGVRTASTLALLVIENGNARVYNAGDSRVYLFRDKQLIKLTRDHVSVKGQRTVALTEEGVRNGGLTKYLGMSEKDGDLEPYRAKPFKIKKGDKFIVCSDGISDYVDEEDMAACMLRRRDPFGHTNELMALALREECADNLSVIVVEIVEPGIHITQNMIMTAICCAALIVGMLVGYIFGFVLGGNGKVRIVQEDPLNNLSGGSSAVVQQNKPNKPDKDEEEKPVSGGDISGSDISGSDVTTPTSTTAQSGETTTTTTTGTTKTYYCQGIDLSTATDVTIYVGDTFQVKWEIYPADIPTSGIQFTSSNPEVATVDAEGKITAVKGSRNGRSARITLTCGGQTAEMVVRVKTR